ncbi:hypothetical protein PHPALM_31144 [Phytophthora palmivora]|uniref:Uncharacterized protein n=1 Tax=Phytophthora palmivora TaxID=4796 RepID=A0A2P4X3B7_9STRA|nr:hypothetical protein PHPALM_31144 [Phytophthora palmivora]
MELGKCGSDHCGTILNGRRLVTLSFLKGAQMGLSAIGGVKVMVNHLQEHYCIDKLEQKASCFCARCLLRLHVKRGNIIPRP